MDLKTALTQLKKVGPDVKLPFFYLEADAKGKPVVLVGNSIATEKPKVLKGAKSNKTAAGKMALSADGNLKLQARGNGMDKLLTNMKKVASAASSVVKQVSLGAPEAEEAAPAAAEGAAPAAEQKPAAPAAWKTTPMRAGDRVSDLAQRAANATGIDEAAFVDSLGFNKASAAAAPAAAPAPKTPPAADAWQRSGASGPKKTFEGMGNQRFVPPPVPAVPPRPPGKPPGPTAPKAAAPAAPETREDSQAAVDKLMAQREKLQNALDVMAKSNPMGQAGDAAVKARDKLREMDDEIRSRMVKLDETGFAKKAMMPKYTDEDKKVGWHADQENLLPKPPVITSETTADEAHALKARYESEMAVWRKYQESTATTRKNFSAQERADSVMSVDAEGKFRDAKGNLVTNTDKPEYVMDAEEGKFHQFGAGIEKTGKKATAWNGRTMPEQKRVHHTSVLAGEDVAGAGGITVEKGEVTMVTNLSGHYQPGVAQTIQTVEALLKLGALLDKTWVDKDGKPLTGQVLELHNRTKRMQASITQRLQADPKADVKADQAKLDAALAMGRKLGLGPANKIRDNAEVGMLDITPGMTGPEIKEMEDEVEENAIPAGEFLRTGGGNEEQAESKDDMMQELRQVTAQKRADLDARAKTGVGPKPVTPEEVAAQNNQLRRRTPRELRQEQEQAAAAARAAGGERLAEEKSVYSNVLLEESEQDAAGAAGGGGRSEEKSIYSGVEIDESENGGENGGKAKYTDVLPGGPEEGSARQGAAAEKTNYVQPNFGGDNAEDEPEAGDGKANYIQPGMGEEEEEPGTSESRGGDEKTTYVQPDIGGNHGGRSRSRAGSTNEAAGAEKTNYVQPDIVGDEDESESDQAPASDGGSQGRATYVQPDIGGEDEEKTGDAKATYSQPNIGEEEAETEEIAGNKTNYGQPDLGEDEGEKPADRKATYTDPFTDEPVGGKRRG